MSNKTRFQSRKTSRNRVRIQALSPCSRFSYNMGINPFQALLNSIAAATMSPEEKAVRHAIKMLTEQKKAKARSQRRSQNRGN